MLTLSLGKNFRFLKKEYSVLQNAKFSQKKSQNDRGFHVYKLPSRHRRQWLTFYQKTILRAGSPYWSSHLSDNPVVRQLSCPTNYFSGKLWFPRVWHPAWTKSHLYDTPVVRQLTCTATHLYDNSFPTTQFLRKVLKTTVCGSLLMWKMPEATDCVFIITTVNFLISGHHWENVFCPQIRGVRLLKSL